LTNNARIQRVEQWIFNLLCAFSLFCSLSNGLTNVALGLICPLFLYRLYLGQVDWRSVIRAHPGIMACIGAFITSTFLSTLISPEFTKGFMIFLNYSVYRMLPFAITLLWVREKKQLLLLIGLFVFSVFANNLLTIGQALLAPDTMNRRFYGVLNPMAQAGLLSAMIPFLFLILARRAGGRFQPLIPVLLIVAVAALLFNGTRGAWLAVAITTPITLAFAVQDWKRYLAGILTALVLGTAIFSLTPSFRARLATLGQMDFQSNSERVLMWKSAYHMFEDHPLLGIGVGHYSKAYKTKYILPEARERRQGHAHSNPMQMLAERGALGFTVFSVMWGYFMYFGLSGWRRTRQTAYLAFFAIVLGVMLQGLTEYNLGTVVVSKCYWFSLAIAMQWIALTRKGNES